MGFSTKTRTQSTQQQTEDPTITAFRNSLYPRLTSMMDLAAKPTYGAAEYANMLNQANAATTAGGRKLASDIAARGGTLNTGGYAAGLSDLYANRANQIGNYNFQVPRLNREEQIAGMGQ